MTPFFSVVIPVYNRAGMLAAALRSVLAQTGRDFEILVVDDGSKDSPGQVVAAFNDPRLHYVRQDNRGGGAARNTGIDRARGRFVAFLDSDDRFLPGHLAKMRTLLEGTSNTAGFARIVVDRGQGRAFLKPPRALRENEHMATYLLCDRGFVPTITTVVETAMARRIRYSEDLRGAEDTDFALRLFLAGCRFVMADEPGAVWLDVPDPNRLSSGRKFLRLIPWIEKLRGQIPERAYFGCYGWAIARAVAKTDKPQALKFYLRALFRGCYSPRLAGVIFLQIFLPDALYRGLADSAVAWLRAGFRRRPSDKRPARA